MLVRFNLLKNQIYQLIYWRFLFLTYVRIVLLACSYLNLSKNSSLNTFFSKADAKVRLIFEPPKLFEVFFQKSFFWSGKVQNLIFVQYFNSSAFLSRKRVQKYCFTAYAPNLHNTFFMLFCILPPKSLILKRCRTAYFEYLWSRKRPSREHYI